jgi:putative phage-type endonuclease
MNVKPKIKQPLDGIELQSDSDNSLSSEESVIDLPKNNSPLPLNERLKPSEFYEKYVARTNEECLKELSAPQKSQGWLNARSLCITASQFGAAINESPYQTPDELIVEKLWNTFTGNSATQWGNDHEVHAKEVFIPWFKQYLKTKNGHSFHFKEENLMKYSNQPWMAVSPDGIITYTINDITYTDLVEFKCPAYLRNTKNHPYAKHDLNTPSHYKSQIQGIMGYLNSYGNYSISKCWFVVWQPHQTWITLHKYDEPYYQQLYEKLNTWYFTKLLPAFTHRHNKLLLHGTSYPQDPIDIIKEAQT